MDPVNLYYMGIGVGLLAGWIWLSNLGNGKDEGSAK
jgi:hypothetical protein